MKFPRLKLSKRSNLSRKGVAIKRFKFIDKKTDEVDAWIACKTVRLKKNRLLKNHDWFYNSPWFNFKFICFHLYMIEWPSFPLKEIFWIIDCLERQKYQQKHLGTQFCKALQIEMMTNICQKRQTYTSKQLKNVLKIGYLFPLKFMMLAISSSNY